MRRIHAQEVEDIALGAAVLGSGGGGNPYVGMLMARNAVQEYGPVSLYTLDELDNEDLVIPIAGMGSPTVSVEKLPSGDDLVNALLKLGHYLGKPVKAAMSMEAGGMNSVVPIYVAARLGMPLVDCDGMGRAFPELQMLTMSLAGIPATPMAMADERGNTVLMDTLDNNWTEAIARAVTITMGGTAQIALYAATAGQLSQGGIQGTMTLAEDIGRTLRLARTQEDDPIEAVRRVVKGFVIFNGKVSDVRRVMSGGFARGAVQFDGFGSSAGLTCEVEFQNEFLIARIDGTCVVTTPDLIVMLDSETGEPITTEVLRYGMRVAVLACPCSDKWRTPEGLKVVGPRYFGYDVDYVPVEVRQSQ